jgi:hypothetical protein
VANRSTSAWFTADTGGGSQTFAIAGMTATPQGARFYAVSATALDTVTNNPSQRSSGYTNGTSEFSKTALRHDVFDTVRAHQQACDDAVIVWLNNGANPPTTQTKASFSSFGAGSVTVSWSSAPSAAFRILVVLDESDDDIACGTMDVVGDPATATVNHDILAANRIAYTELLQGISGASPWNTVEFNVESSTGIVTAETSTITQHCWSQSLQTSGGGSWAQLYEGEAVAERAPTANSTYSRIACTAFAVSTGDGNNDGTFTLTAENDIPFATINRIGYYLIGNGSLAVDLNLADTPTSTGTDWVHSDPGYEPDYVELITTRTPDSAAQVDDDSNTTGRAIVTADGVQSWSMSDLDSAPGTGAALASATSLQVLNGQTVLVDAVPALDANGFTASQPHTAMPAAVTRHIVLSREMDADVTVSPGDATIASTIGDLSTAAFEASEPAAAGEVTIGGTFPDLTITGDATQSAPAVATISSTIGNLVTVAFDAEQDAGDVVIASTIGDLSTAAFEAEEPAPSEGDVIIASTIGDLSTAAFEAQALPAGAVTIASTIGDLVTAAFEADARLSDGNGSRVEAIAVAVYEVKAEVDLV